MSGDRGEPEIEKRYIHKDGRIVWGLVRAGWVRNPDGSARVALAHILDITERVRRETELVRKTAEMERFTHMVSHDLRSPLVTIQTFLDYLERDLASGHGERTAGDLGFIRGATTKMGRLLEDLLEVSRVGRLAGPPSEMTLDDLVREGLASVAGALSGRKVAVRCASGPLRLRGDRRRLEGLWQNLIENAVKYLGDQPEPRIEIGQEPEGGEAVFFVRDNGMGIHPKYHEKIFELFEKLDGASEGTGLGLAMARRIVEMHGGRIWVESAGPGTGSCFRFTLPGALVP
jgi:signal transduction histidine kinase